MPWEASTSKRAPSQAAYLVGKIHVAGRINEVENILNAIGRMNVFHLNGMALDRNTTLTLEVHIVERLVLHIALANGVGVLQQAVSKRAFTVIDVCDDAEIADVLHEVVM